MKIGVFDSGLGGLTVLKELVKLLPHHSFIYFADTANCPYGHKSKDEIITLSKRITEFLISKNCQAIVVACNTATASAIDFLRENYDIPFIGMEPAVKPAALSTKTKSIGVLATEGTFNGRLYRETTSKYAANVNVTYQIGEGLVELVERGESTSTQALELLTKYVKPMVDNNIDHLVLGCTHYPFFTPLLNKILPNNIRIINPAPAVAKQTKRVLQQRNNEGSNDKGTLPSVHFYSSAIISTLRMLVKEIESNNGNFQNKEFFEKISLP
ncbi:MAG: glutamate racemase [Bacteroidales bacterium]